MSNTNTNGGPAFPEIRIRGGDNYNPPMKLYYGGMTLRDYFAAKAMRLYFLGEDSASLSGDPKQIAAWSYAVADAMLKARGDTE